MVSKLDPSPTQLERNHHRVMRVLAVAACALVATCAVAAPAPRLVDVRSGASVALEPGPVALHVVFFATWCPPCLDELGALAELKSRHADRRYRLVLVAVRGRQELSRLRGFLESRPGVPGEWLFDADGQAEAHWRADGLPTHVVLDATGQEVARSGALDAAIEGAVAGLLARRPAAPRSPRP